MNYYFKELPGIENPHARKIFWDSVCEKGNDCVSLADVNFKLGFSHSDAKNNNVQVVLRIPKFLPKTSVRDCREKNANLRVPSKKHPQKEPFAALEESSHFAQGDIIDQS
ncbi:MAG: hypothetical protein WBW71_13240 [Bacteroidota bacterium]